jgi:hypothetical protein
MSCYSSKYLVVCSSPPRKILVMAAAVVHLTRNDGYFRYLTSVFQFTELPTVLQKTGNTHVLYDEHNICILYIMKQNV